MELAMKLMKEYLGNENIQNKFENSDNIFRKGNTAVFLNDYLYMVLAPCNKGG